MNLEIMLNSNIIDKHLIIYRGNVRDGRIADSGSYLFPTKVPIGLRNDQSRCWDAHTPALADL